MKKNGEGDLGECEREREKRREDTEIRVLYALTCFSLGYVSFHYKLAVGGDLSRDNHEGYLNRSLPVGA